jgi:microcystin-dependent protein
MAEAYIGEIRMFGGMYAPVGWALCNGQELPISGNEVLFGLIGTTYGGDGRTKFCLPNLSGRVPIHMGTSAWGTFGLGQNGGEEKVTLTTSQLPEHTHAVRAFSQAGDTNMLQNNVWAKGVTKYADAQSQPTAAMNPNSLSPAGGSQAHENMMSTLTISFIISISGIRPPRD